MSNARTPRIGELDALRGMAALVVVVGHWFALIPGWDADGAGGPGHELLHVLRTSPLRIVGAAPEAVLVFFVLSGFVLALPSFAGRRPRYGEFLVRRAFRIYPAAWAALAGAAMLATVGGSGPLVGASAFVNAVSASPADVAGILGHADLLRGSDSLKINGVLWSLVHELRVSLIFPVLVVTAVALGSLRVCALAAIVSLVAFRHAGGHPGTDLVGTSAYLVCFVVGIVLARHRAELLAACTRLSGSDHRLLWVAAVLLLTSPYTVGSRVPGFGAQGLHVLVPTAGAALVVVLAQARHASALLQRRVPMFVGRISYSLYLWHVPILVVLARTAGQHVLPIALAPAGIALALLIATASHRWIEVPLTRLGARIGSSMSARARSTTAAGRRAQPPEPVTAAA